MRIINSVIIHSFKCFPTMSIIFFCLCHYCEGRGGLRLLQVFQALSIFPRDMPSQCTYAASFGWSWGPLMVTVAALSCEIFTIKIRPTGQSISVGVNFSTTFVLSQTFLTMLCHFQYGSILVLCWLDCDSDPFYSSFLAILCMQYGKVISSGAGLLKGYSSNNFNISNAILDFILMLTVNIMKLFSSLYALDILHKQTLISLMKKSQRILLINNDTKNRKFIY